MRLKSMELQGFKSFVDKTEIAFEDGITAVVGPNGSGKSNVSDALRWVLGEQSAKTLRGTKMEDIIFSGTEKRNPVGFCKVSLTFENDDHWLNIEQNEVAVTRKYYKSGESEYYINNSQCRLKDLLELFRDTGVGKEGYSIVGQGQIDAILSNAANRRTAFEAATGILKYKTRKTEAQARLVKTGENIDRLNDVLFEISNNLESLEEQSAKAKEYIAARDSLKTYELSGFIYKKQEAEKKTEKLTNELKELEKHLFDFAEEEEQLKQKRVELSNAID
ncbi:MAG: AAA family ATPase, partial [Clostridia bacterium]|nr:AAA family ATPase [Clostridia bacterium]